MQKIKSITSLILFTLLAVFSVKSSLAAPVVYIQQLPSYINTNSFNLSCTSNGNSAQFYVSKNGGAETSFGSAIDLTANECLVAVTSSQVNDQTSYTFTVTVDGVSASTSTIFDNSGPGSVSSYYKERTNDGQYKLHWKNPGETDFDKVVIYRGESADFSADNNHEIARVNGSPNSDMSYDDNFAPDANKTYYYAIRALDHAGNSGGLIGDGGTTTTTVTSSAKPAVLGAATKSSKVNSLPKEEGSVLGSDTKATSTPEATTTAQMTDTESVQNTGFLAWIMDHKKITIGIILLLALVIYYLRKSGKNK